MHDGYLLARLRRALWRWCLAHPAHPLRPAARALWVALVNLEERR